MPDLLLPFLIFCLSILTSAVYRTSAGLRRPSGEILFRAMVLRTILGLGVLASKANIVQAAPQASDVVFAAVLLIGLEAARALLVVPMPYDD